MLKSQKHVKCWCMLLFIIWLTGCLPIEEWVKKRGFKYDKNYSTTNKLGYKVVRSIPKPNPSWEFKSRRGNIPDLKYEKNRTIKLKGGAELSEILKHITDANLATQLKFARCSKVTFQGPFYEEAVVFIPTYIEPGLSKKRLKIIDRVLNCGRMEIKIYNEYGVNVSAKFEVQKTGGFSGSLNYNEDSNSIISGENFYTGYDVSTITLTTSSPRKITVDSKTRMGNKFGVWYKLGRIRKIDEEPEIYEADIRLIVHSMGSKINPSVAHIKKLENDFIVTSVKEKGLLSLLQEFPTDDKEITEAVYSILWEGRKNIHKIKNATNRTPIFGVLESAKKYTVKGGDEFAIAASEEVSYLFLFERVTRSSVTFYVRRNVLK